MAKHVAGGQKAECGLPSEGPVVALVARAFRCVEIVPNRKAANTKAHFFAPTSTEGEKNGECETFRFVDTTAILRPLDEYGRVE